MNTSDVHVEPSLVPVAIGNVYGRLSTPLYAEWHSAINNGMAESRPKPTRKTETALDRELTR